MPSEQSVDQPVYVKVVAHDDGGGYYVLFRDPVTGLAGGRGAGLHLQAATDLARRIRDREEEL